MVLSKTERINHNPSKIHKQHGIDNIAACECVSCEKRSDKKKCDETKLEQLTNGNDDDDNTRPQCDLKSTKANLSNV